MQETSPIMWLDRTPHTLKQTNAYQVGYINQSTARRFSGVLDKIPNMKNEKNEKMRI